MPTYFLDAATDPNAPPDTLEAAIRAAFSEQDPTNTSWDEQDVECTARHVRLWGDAAPPPIDAAVDEALEKVAQYADHLSNEGGGDPVANAISDHARALKPQEPADGD